MGNVSHHAIVVTSWKRDVLKDARKYAKKLKLEVTEIVESKWNSFATFVVLPDGSKEGWRESIDGDDRRAKLKERLLSYRYDDKSSCLEWVEVQYGRDDYGIGGVGAKVTDHEWVDKRGRA